MAPRFLRLLALTITAATIVACSGSAQETSSTSNPATATEPSEGGGGSSPSSAVLAEGPIAPGSYVIMPPDVGWAECMEGVESAPAPDHAETMQLEINVPSGWASIFTNVIALASPKSSEGPDGAGLVIGWNAVGLHSDPCRPVPHSTPDILIGPTVEEFVGAVVEHPSLEVTEPEVVELGGYSGQFLTLTGPSDISDCLDWRPWEHGIPAQGAENIWSLWVMDVDGLRMIVLAEEFPGTSAEAKAELRMMAESIRFELAP